MAGHSKNREKEVGRVTQNQARKAGGGNNSKSPGYAIIFMEGLA